MILVTGASGQLGRKIVQELKQNGADLRLMVRDRTKVADIDGVDVVEGDYKNVASLQAAFQGIERAFIVSLHERPMERAKLHRNAFWAARDAAVNYVVYTSFQGADSNASFNMARDHYQSEEYLKETGLTFAALRNSFYMESAHEEVIKADGGGIIRNPSGDGQVGWVCRDDIAQVAAYLLVNPLKESATLDVTGPEAPKLSELAQLLSELSGKTIKFENESYEQGLAWRQAYGLVGWDLEAWISSDVAKGNGETSQVSNTVEQLLGRKAYSLREFYEENPSYIEALKRSLS